MAKTNYVLMSYEEIKSFWHSIAHQPLFLTEVLIMHKGPVNHGVAHVVANCCGALALLKGTIFNSAPFPEQN